MLVDDHPLWRETLRQVIHHRGVGKVVAEASDGDEALERAQETRPEIVVMDIALRESDGIETTRRLMADMPEMRVLVLSSSDDSSVVIDAIRAGACGYLLKTVESQDVAEAIRRIGLGELVFPSELSSVVLSQLRGEQETASIRVTVAATEVLDREGLAKLLEEAGFKDVRRFAGTAQLLRALADEAVDVTVIDLGPGREGDIGPTVQQLRLSRPEMGLLLLSDDVEPSHAIDLISEAGGGGVGYILKHRLGDLGELEATVRRVAAGEYVVDADVANKLIAKPGKRSPLAEVSPRELEVLELMAQGRSNQAICHELSLSLRTVEAHVTSIFMKLGLEPTMDDHRRVMAVLTFLRSS